MTRQEIIKAIETCYTVGHNCTECHLFAEDDCNDKLMRDVLKLLKMQEPHKKGYWKYPQSLDCCCSECGNQPDHEPGESVPLYNYCPYCGAEMAVKWDD